MMPQVIDDAPTAFVRRVVYDYVEKGTFRHLKEHVEPDGSTVFRFSWLSENEKVVLDLNHERDTLSFRGILPAMPERVQSFVEAFVSDRGPDGAVPAHRRVASDLGELYLEKTKTDDRTSIGLIVRNGRYADATRKLVNLLNEMVFSLQMRHADYTYASFSAIDE